MDLSKIEQIMSSELQKEVKCLSSRMLSHLSEIELSSTIIQISIALHELLRREFLDFCNSERATNKDTLEYESYSIIHKYVGYWNTLSSLCEHASRLRNDNFQIDRNHFYSVLMANNPHVYSIFLNSINSISLRGYSLNI